MLLIGWQPPKLSNKNKLYCSKRTGIFIQMQNSSLSPFLGVILENPKILIGFFLYIDVKDSQIFQVVQERRYMIE